MLDSSQIGDDGLRLLIEKETKDKSKLGMCINIITKIGAILLSKVWPISAWESGITWRHYNWVRVMMT